jgi:hypothetical protein
MMLKPGDKVICVDVAPSEGAGPANILSLKHLNEGRAYIISEVGIARDGKTMVNVEGVDIRQVSRALDGFKPVRFKKIVTAKADFTEMLRAIKPVGKKERERA